MHAQTRLTARIAFASSVVAFALASSVAHAQTRMPTHVACVGDSITYGYAASSSSKSYPSVLQTMFTGVTVGNFGRNSATLLSGGDLPYIKQTEYTSATTFVANAGASAVVDVIIMLGTNDSKSYNWVSRAGSTPAQQVMTDLGAMVDHFTNLSTHPVVYLAIPPAIYTNSFGISETVTNNEIAPAIRQVATQKGLPIIDVHAKTVSRADLFSDGVHPTDAGYTYLAQVMHDGLLAASTTGTGGAGGAGRGGSGGSGGSGGAGASGSTGTGGRGGAGGRAGAGGAGGSAGSVGTAGGGGTSGSTGTGARGGTDGTAGGAGTTGAAGSSGTVGTTGGAGSSGSAGTTGGAGSSGSAGTTGGASGTTGVGGAPTGTGGKAATGGGAGAAGSGNDGGGGGCRVGNEPRGGVIVGLAMIAFALCRSLRHARRIRRR